LKIQYISIDSAQAFAHIEISDLLYKSLISANPVRFCYVYNVINATGHKVELQ